MASTFVVFDGNGIAAANGLWVSDGTAAGTMALTVAGANALSGLAPGDFLAFGSQVFFTGTDSAGNDGVWVTNGTAAGTAELAVAGTTHSFIAGGYTAFHGRLYLRGYGGNGLQDLWSSDGTGAGTTTLNIAGAAAAGLVPFALAVVNGRLLFAGNSSADGHTLWTSDGTAAGTVALAATGAAAGGVTPEDITAISATAGVFSGAGAAGTSGLWITDGTAAGTTEITVNGASANGLFNDSASAYGYSVSPGFTLLGSRMLFAGYDSGDKVGLWVTDGTTAGTTEILAGAGSLGLLPSGGFHPWNGKLVFAGLDASGAWGLWQTDGTTAGTTELVSGLTPSYGSVIGGVAPPSVTTLGSEILFQRYDVTGNIGRSGLWETNGTITQPVAAAGASGAGVTPEYIGAFGTGALFRGTDLAGAAGLWVTDGSTGGTAGLNVAGVPATGLSPTAIAFLGSVAVFAGTDAAGHQGLWVTNGTAAGTSELTVAGAASAGLAPTGMTSLGTIAVFAGTDTHGHQGLWVTDGTAAGTAELSVVGSSASGLTPLHITALGGGRAMFAGCDATGALGLWVTNGTTAGTSEITPAGAPAGGLQPIAFASLGSTTLFATAGGQIWTTDGTAGGTQVVISATVWDNMVALGGKVYFVAGSSGAQALWASDGTTAGTAEVTAAARPMSNLVVLNGKILFGGVAASGLEQLWVSDGTAAGTMALTVAGANTQDGLLPGNLSVVGGHVYFNGLDASGVTGLWATDGTAAGTAEVSVDNAGLGGLDPLNLTTVTLPTACFATGTRLLAARGEVAVEALGVGERVATLSGRLARVRWIGHRRIDLSRHGAPAEVMPVRIAAHAFGVGMPHRDLRLSPDHAVYLADERVLVPARYLVNGATLAPETMDEVTYWHVELDRHEILLADGLPSESYLDTGNRSAFANGGGVTMASPSFAMRRWDEAACAPLLQGGAGVAAARRRLRDRATRLQAAPEDTDSTLPAAAFSDPSASARNAASARAGVSRRVTCGSTRAATTCPSGAMT